MKKKPTQKKEIMYNIINSALAGVLVLLGSLTAGSITFQGLATAAIASLLVAVSQFKKYWDSEKAEYCNTKLFTFIK
jgi:hypothetical protein